MQGWKQVRPVALLLISLGLASTVVFAQGGSKLSPRGLMLAKRADAMSVTVFRERSGKKTTVDPAEAFRAGDQVRVSFQSNFDGYIYIVNVMPSGKKRLLFPSTDEKDNKVTAEVAYVLPKGAFEFDSEKGTEVLQIIASRATIPYLDAQMANPNGDFADDASDVSTDLNTDVPSPAQPAGTAARAAKEIEGGIGAAKTEITSIVPTNVGSLRARGLVFEPPKRKGFRKTTDTVVAIPVAPSESTPATLREDEVMSFEIRLKHV
jgi:hypothetical protein